MAGKERDRSVLPDYAPKPGHIFCAPGEIEEGAGKDFVFRGEDKKMFLIFIVRKNKELYAYLNMCPHWGLPLNWKPGKFFTPDGKYLFCANHAAAFQVEDGFCVSGPCRGASLLKLNIEIEDNNVIMGEWPSTPEPQIGRPPVR